MASARTAFAFRVPVGASAATATIALLGVATLVFASFADLLATMRNHKSPRFLINFLNSFYALAVLGYQANARRQGPFVAIGPDARVVARDAHARPPLFVLLVGDTVRADQFSRNRYGRPTSAAPAR